MISQEYLNLLDDISSENNGRYCTLPAEKLVDELTYLWECLQYLYRTEHCTVTLTLNELAAVSYLLLWRLTSQDWDTIISSAKDLHIRKNAGYSPEDTDAWANFRECTEFGISAADGCLVRLCDKYRRFFNVYTNPENDKVSESAIDTLRDLAAYSVILICLLEENSHG